MMRNFLIIFRNICLILLLTIFSMLIGGFWLEQWQTSEWSLAIHYFFAPIIELFVFLLGLKYLKKLFIDQTPIIIWPPKFRRKDIYYGLLLVLICSLGGILIGGKVVFPSLDLQSFVENLVTLLGVCLISPFIEEVVFRVVIFREIAHRWGNIIGIICSSLIFGAVHLMNGPLDLISGFQLIIGGTLMGILLNVVFLSANSVWASYIVHALYNALTSIIPIGIMTTTDWPIQFILNTKNTLLTGGEYGIDCSLVNIIGYILMIIIVTKTNTFSSEVIN